MGSQAQEFGYRITTTRRDFEKFHPPLPRAVGLFEKFHSPLPRAVGLKNFTLHYHARWD